MIELKNVNKVFEHKPVLHNINAGFYKGKCNFVIGASGSGKSVMMKCMVGLMQADSGQILYEGKDFLHLDYQQRQSIRREIGMLFQGTALFDSLTVEDNVGFPLKMFTSMTPGELKERVDFCLKSFVSFFFEWRDEKTSWHCKGHRLKSKISFL